MAGALREVHCPLLERDVVLPESPERIVSLAPALTDAVAALRGLDVLAGRSAWCHRPEGVEDIPVAGSYTECRRGRLKVLEPDLILATGGVQEPLARRLAAEGWPVYLVPLPSSPWGIVENVTVLGTVTGVPEAALHLARRCHRVLSGLRDVLPPLVTWVEIDLGDPVTTGLGSWITWSLRWVGLRPTGWGDPRAHVVGRDGARPLEPPELVLFDPAPGRRPSGEAVRERFREGETGRWIEAHARFVVTEGDVLAHSGPWFILEGLPAVVSAVRRVLGR